jgi:hypothetical protein
MKIQVATEHTAKKMKRLKKQQQKPLLKSLLLIKLKRIKRLKYSRSCALCDNSYSGLDFSWMVLRFGGFAFGPLGSLDVFSVQSRGKTEMRYNVFSISPQCFMFSLSLLIILNTHSDWTRSTESMKR